MAQILLFHHALGQSPGFLAFADALRAEGHSVHSPDLFEGRTFIDVDTGVAYAEEVGFETIIERGVAAADGLPEGVVYVGLSLGAMPAQRLAMQRPGARGALLIYGLAPLEFFGGSWPDGVPLQIHLTEGDEDIEVAREVKDQVPSAELFEYPGSAHLFAESGSPDYDAESAALLTQRVLSFLR